MIKTLADTNIFVAILRGDSRLKDVVEGPRYAINTIVYLELIQGAKNKLEVRKIEEYLAAYELIHFDLDVSRRSIDLIRAYSPSHGLMLPDAVIAATCLINDFSLLTFNTRDFRFIDGLTVIGP